MKDVLVYLFGSDWVCESYIFKYLGLVSDLLIILSEAEHLGYVEIYNTRASKFYRITSEGVLYLLSI